MRIYLDDDLDSNLLINLLRLAGHEVISPRAAGMRGATDEEHLRYAFSQRLVLLTANAADFIDLHENWMAQHREHCGILAVHRENNPVRDMSLRQIAEAVTHLEQSQIPVINTVQNLNSWRQ